MAMQHIKTSVKLPKRSEPRSSWVKPQKTLDAAIIARNYDTDLRAPFKVCSLKPNWVTRKDLFEEQILKVQWCFAELISDLYEW